jgi:CubicO group peptidase (beta-lactamase class C family)
MIHMSWRVEGRKMKITKISKMLFPMIALSLMTGCSSVGKDRAISMPGLNLDPAIGGSLELSASPKESHSPGTITVDLQEVSAFFDDYFNVNLPRFHVPGATVTVVKDGELLFSNGYGYADLEQQIPYQPDETVFWAASIAKIFTVVGMLQLEEQGFIQLDDDINRYLQDLQIPETFSQPITFRHLLTHTDGFEARIIGDAARTPADLRPLSEVVRANLPLRIAQPGRFLTYGNYGINLAGVLIEEISGVPYSSYMADQIFEPLEMVRTTFKQSLPSEWTPDLAIGYGYGALGFEPKPYVFVDSLPQGGGRSTAIDMAHLMIALLEGGQFEGNRILEEESTESIFQQQFSAHPNLGGVTCGLFEVFRNDRRIFIRDGDGWGFRSRMVLIPEESLGFFVSYNNEDADSLREDLLNEFIDHFYTETSKSPRMDSSSLTEPVEEFTGIYRPLQADESTFYKIALLFAQQIQVKDARDGTLLIEPVGMGDNYGGFEGTSRWIEIEPLYFELEDGNGGLAFGRNDQGEITYLFSGQKYHGAYRKLVWYETPGLHFALLGLSTLVFLNTLALWPLDAWRRSRRASGPYSTSIRKARWLAGAVCVLQLLFSAGLVVVMGNFVDIIYGVPPLLRVILCFPLLATALSPGLLFFAVMAWRDETWSSPGRTYYTLFVLVNLAFIWWTYTWNLLGFNT